MSERIEPTVAIPQANVDRFSRGILGPLPPRVQDSAPLTAGLAPLALGTSRDGLIWTPEHLDPQRPVPAAVMLHGAGGAARQMIDILLALESWRRVVILAPESRGGTWDLISGGYGPDVAFLHKALAHVAGHQELERGRLAIGGFSDGASYALSLGITNGDLFSHIVAFSPGFVAPARKADHPRCFVSHGTRDQVLPIDRCSRRLVPGLQRAGYPVSYREFEGPHTVPPVIADEASGWFLGP